MSYYFREKVEIQYREKELRMNKVNQVGFPKRFYWLMKMGPYLENYSKRYSQSMKPQDMAKVAEAQAEFDHYDKV